MPFIPHFSIYTTFALYDVLRILQCILECAFYNLATLRVLNYMLLLQEMLYYTLCKFRKNIRLRFNNMTLKQNTVKMIYDISVICEIFKKQFQLLGGKIL